MLGFCKQNLFVWTIWHMGLVYPYWRHILRLCYEESCVYWIVPYLLICLDVPGSFIKRDNCLLTFIYCLEKQ